MCGQRRVGLVVSVAVWFPSPSVCADGIAGQGAGTRAQAGLGVGVPLRYGSGEPVAVTDPLAVALGVGDGTCARAERRSRRA